jgi:phosphoribosyl-ATP pyrophosphohydrolase/phosphoribosyl-AMP cyclohydrolase
MKIESGDVKFDEHGLIPAIVQDAKSFEVLTLAYMNAESLERTIETKETWFWSRSRAQLWHKGETSGNKQHVIEMSLDCDHDAIRLLVEPEGPACHTGAQSCFHNELLKSAAKAPQRSADLGEVLTELFAVIESRKLERPEGSYTTYLFDEGLDKILKKLGEESAETIIAAKNDDSDALARETSDLLYHLIVLMVEKGLTLSHIAQELESRRK